MKIAPLTTTDPWFSHVLHHGKATIETLEAVPVDVTVVMEHVGLFTGEAAQRFRPYLALSGQITKVETVGVELPYSVTEMDFSSATGPRIDAVYEFTTEQIMELVRRGYHEEGFEAPSEMVGIDWVLPTKANLVFVQPMSKDEPPVVFVGLGHDKILKLNEENSGYELAAYFPQIGAEAQGEAERVDAPLSDLTLGHQGIEAHEGDLQLDTPSDEIVAESAHERAEEFAQDPAAQRYVEKIASRLAAEGSLSEPTPTEAGMEFIPLNDDGYLTFELDDNMLDEGSIVFDFDDGEVDDVDWEVDDTVYELEPHQRASVVEASKPKAVQVEQHTGATHDGIKHAAKLPAYAGVIKTPRPHSTEEPHVEESVDLELG